MANSSPSSVNKHISETSSRCRTECVTTAHNFEVTEYSLLEGMGIGKFVSSSTFSVGGYNWNIRIYPDGRKEEDKAAYMGAFLSTCSNPTTGVQMKNTFSLLEKDGKVTCLYSDTRTFRSGSWGWPKYIEKSKLKELLSRNDDCITIRCVLTVMKEPRTEDVSTVMVQVPQSDLQTHFTNMLNHGEGMDVTFTVGRELFSAHRCVLAARSLVFKAELFGQMKETTKRRVKINDMEPAIFEALLHFIYTDSWPSNCDLDQNVELQHLLVAADRYGLERLKIICEGKLCQKIDVQTVATTLALAEQHHATQLKNACLRYLSSQELLRAVKETDGFKHLTASCPWIMMDILERAAPPSGV
ncbi:BTB/POZ and MATH domain-containing protein 2-like [Aegilops tauschii subsp. strangulata]|uniref:BTB/POZ and MATH domain-containing protein 2-like n=1 Tax=Aegilops tauschii subsp. strangulata TaxID=200361 RepID=UPI00098A636E|nr:BTB/POZ and MATH domain-containing protein 2-like [Aegilops tauschii subsp. strangulata]